MTEKDMTYIYNEVFSMEKDQIESLKKDLLRKYKTAQDTFSDADAEDQENLKRFSFICLLSFDVYMKKMMIEHLIDGMNPPAEHNGKKKKESWKHKHMRINYKTRNSAYLYSYIR